MWTLLIVELVIVALVAAVWLVGPLIGLKSVLARVVVITVLALPPLVFVFLKILKRRKDEKGLESELRQQGADQVDGVRPDRRAEIEKLGKQFDEAISALKASKLGGAGGSPLYALPWYMIIGPPGAGKSTALLRSGLNFPYTTGEAVKGVGGTRNCDWWFSDQAILLDTAGRYTLQDDDREEWNAFLKMLKRYRGKRPLNGLIVCVSVAEIVGAPAAQVEAMAVKIRQRLDELLDQLELHVPVYLLLSKCDLLSGFVESFGKMKKSVRSQVLGFTVPLTSADADIEPLVQAELGLLERSLHKRTTAELASADPRLRAGLYRFPLQFAALRAPLTAFTKRLFQPNPYQQTPRLRGVYLCSGTQEGRPLDQLTAGLSQSLGLAPPAQPQLAKAQKSYFLRDLFTEVMFPDQTLAGTSTRGKSKRLRARVVALALAVVVASAVIGFGATSYSNNSSLVSSTVSLAKAAVRGAGAEEPKRVIARLQALDKLAARHKWLSKLDKDRPLTYGLGYYSGGKLLERVRRVFTKQAKRTFVDAAGAELEATLTDVSASAPAGAAKRRSKSAAAAVIKDYDLLKTYIMVTSPEHLDVRFAASTLIEQWKKRLHPDVAKETDLLTRVASAYLQLLKEKRARWLAVDNDLIKNTRRALRARDVEYLRLVASAIDALPPLSLRDLLRGRVQTVIKSKHSVPGIYTRPGFKLHMRTKLALDKGLEPWVLGSADAAADVAAQLRTRYFTAYSSHWRKFLRGLSLGSSGSVKETLKLLQTLTDAPPLYQTLFGAIAFQTTFPAPEPKKLAGSKLLPGRLKKVAKGLGALKKARDANKKKKLNLVEKDFKRLNEMVIPPLGPDGKPQVAGLAQYMAQLHNVRDKMAEFVANTDKPDATAMNKALADARRITAGVLAALPAALRSSVASLFYAPLLGAAQQASAAHAALTSSSFNTEVCEAFNEKLRGRYPFATSSRDALLADAVEFFSPTGTVWAYYNTSLKARLLRKGDRFSEASGRKVPAPIVAFYNRAWAVSRALFARGSAVPRIRFEVRPQPASIAPGSGYAVSEIAFELGKKKKTYRNGPLELWKFEWPQGSSARLIIRGAGGLREELSARGDWALLRLIDRAKVKARRPWYRATWSLKGGKIKVHIDFRPSRTHSPLFKRMPLSCHGG